MPSLITSIAQEIIWVSVINETAFHPHVQPLFRQDWNHREVFVVLKEHTVEQNGITCYTDVLDHFTFDCSICFVFTWLNDLRLPSSLIFLAYFIKDWSPF